MKVLIIEDDNNKLGKVREFLASECPNFHLLEAHSCKSAILSLVDDKDIDFVIADMTLPMYDGGEFGAQRVEHFGGKMILDEMVAREINTPAVVLTQFDVIGEGEGTVTLAQLDQELRDAYPTIYRGAVYYNAEQSAWQRELTDKILELPAP